MKIEAKDCIRTIAINKDRRKLLFGILLMSALILFLASYAQPIIYLTAQVKPVTDKDYKLFLENSQHGYGGNAPLEKRTRENCRLLTVELQIKKPFLLARNVKIDKDNLNRYLEEKQYFDKSSDKIHALGSYHLSDTNYHSIDGIDLFFEGMNDETVYRFFGDYKIELSWIDLFNKEHKEVYYLKDYY